jgi:transcription initiation factor TFIIIB Brf1 subunit/transcription initiation factor TFIIB
MHKEYRRACELCKQRNPSLFVYDDKHADLICTVCGCVQRGINAQWLYGDTAAFHSPVHTVKSAPRDAHPQEKAAAKTNLSRQAELYDRMTNRMCRKENAERRLEMKIERFAAVLDYPERFVTQCHAMFNKFKALRMRRPSEQTVAAALIVAKRECGFFEDISRVSEALALGDLGSHVMAVYKIAKISHRSRIDQNIPAFVVNLGFPYRFAHRVTALFKFASRLNGAVASKTLLGLVLWRFYQANVAKSKADHKVDLELIASMTGSSPATLGAYMAPGRCTVYPDEDDMKDVVIPAIVETMGFASANYRERAWGLFCRYRKENPGVDPQVVLGLVLWRLYQANAEKTRVEVTLHMVADLTWSYPATLKAYIENGGCTVFKAKKRRRIEHDDDTHAQKKQIIA